MYFFSNSPVKWRYVGMRISTRSGSKVAIVARLYLDKSGFSSTTVTDYGILRRYKEMLERHAMLDCDKKWE